MSVDGRVGVVVGCDSGSRTSGAVAVAIGIGAGRGVGAAAVADVAGAIAVVASVKRITVQGNHPRPNLRKILPNSVQRAFLCGTHRAKACTLDCRSIA